MTKRAKQAGALTAEARAKVERVLSARRRLGLMSPAEREEILRQMGAVIAPAPVGTSASVRGV